MSLFKHRLVRGVSPSRTQQMIVEQRAKELKDFRRMFQLEAVMALMRCWG